MPNVLNLENIEDFSCGSEHNLAIQRYSRDGRSSLHSWGWNEHGNCGNGSTENILMPTKVALQGTLIFKA